MSTRAHLALVADRSGSMSENNMAVEATVAIKDFIAKQAALDGVAVKVSLFEFDHEFTTVYSRQDAAKVPDYTVEPRGMTALYDAIGKAVAETEKQLKPLKNKPDKIVLVVVTDGKENSSSEYSFDALRTLLDQRRAKGWEIVFLASEPQTVAIGRALHLNSSNYDRHTKGGTRAVYGVVGQSVSDFFVGSTETVETPDNVNADGTTD